MKKITKKILTAVCLAAIIAAGCEYPDGGIGLWNIVSLAIVGLSGYGIKRLEEAK